jgi:multiple sugar transport system permease protein
MKNIKKKKISILAIVLFTVLIIYVVSMLFPLIWGLLTSIKHYNNFRIDPVGFPDFSYWANSKIEGQTKWYNNYTYIFDEFHLVLKSTFYEGIVNLQKVNNRSEVTILSSILNTILCVGVTSFLATIVPCIVAYLCSNYKYKFSKLVYSLVLVTMTLPLFGTTPAMVTLLRQLRLYDEFWGMWLMSASFGGAYFLVFHACFASLSTVYAEAAEIDGASQLRVMLSIIFPLVRKTISTIFVLVFVAQWNDYATPLLYLPTKPTIAYSIFYITSRPELVGGEVPKTIAALALPPLYAILQQLYAR